MLFFEEEKLLCDKVFLVFKSVIFFIVFQYLYFGDGQVNGGVQGQWLYWFYQIVNGVGLLGSFLIGGILQGSDVEDGNVEVSDFFFQLQFVEIVVDVDVYQDEVGFLIVNVVECGVGVVGVKGVGIVYFIKEYFQFQGEREVIFNNQDFKRC